MNTDISRFYNRWKTEYLKKAHSMVNGYFIDIKDGGTGITDSTLTHSEAHGYGMIILALMAGNNALAEKDAKEFFDGMYAFVRAHPSEDHPDLMAWEITGKVGSHENIKFESTATDGDMDIAYAMLLAHTQWGSLGEVNYLEEAVKIINAIKEVEIGKTSLRTTMGSWAKYDKEFSEWGSRPSDWMTSHMHSFVGMTGDTSWNAVINEIYQLLLLVQDKNTGLIPDFIQGNPAAPASPDYLESEFDGSYFSNACRVPWRIAMDYAHYGNINAYSTCKTLLDWIIKETDNDPENIKNGYHLNGDTICMVDYLEINKWGPWGSFISPILAASVVDSSYMGFLEKGWDHIRRFERSEGYYSNSIILLNMLFISGNWWAPDKTPIIYSPHISTNLQNSIKKIQYKRCGIINISFSGKVTHIKNIKIFNMKGKSLAPVNQINFNSHTNNVSLHLRKPLSNGIYIIHLTSEKEVSTTKLYIIN